MRAFGLETVPDLRGCEAIIHLAGEPVVGLWTAEKKRRIRDSRVLGTRWIVEAIQASAAPPEVFVSSSAIGFYGDAGERELTETAPAGHGFLPDVCEAWEGEARRVEADAASLRPSTLDPRPSTRLVLLRTSLVLGKDGGALRVMAPLFRAALGGRIGDGQQWMSWIHLHDQAALALFAVENLDVRGRLNAAAPWPVRNADFTRALARAVRRPAFLRVPAFAVRALGEFSHELLDSKRVVPAAASEHGFQFRFPELAAALKDLFP